MAFHCTVLRLKEGGSRILDICVSSDSIENHGVIGNMRSAAAVSLDGAIDFFAFLTFTLRVYLQRYWIPNAADTSASNLN